jgi:hypothetical protein
MDRSMQVHETLLVMIFNEWINDTSTLHFSPSFDWRTNDAG